MFLENRNYIAFDVANGNRALEILQHHRVDLIVLDTQPPDGDCWDFARRMRKYTDIPLFIVSGARSNAEAIKSLSVGADDYIGKPYDLDVLDARIRAHLRRYTQLSSKQIDISSDIQAGFKYDIGEWSLDCAAFQIFDRDNQPGDLTVQEFQVLRLLAENAGRPLTRTELCHGIRTKDYVPTTRALDIKIARIRKKMDDRSNEPRFIKTIRGVGYMLVGASVVRPGINAFQDHSNRHETMAS